MIISTLLPVYSQWILIHCTTIFAPVQSSGLEIPRSVFDSSRSSANTDTGSSFPSPYGSTRTKGQTPPSTPPKKKQVNLTHFLHTTHLSPLFKVKVNFSFLVKPMSSISTTCITCTVGFTLVSPKMLEDHLLQAINDRFEADGLCFKNLPGLVN